MQWKGVTFVEINNFCTFNIADQTFNLSTAKKVTPFSRTISVLQIIYFEKVCLSRDYSSLFSSNLDYPLHPKPRWSNSRDFIISKLSSKNWAERWNIHVIFYMQWKGVTFVGINNFCTFNIADQTFNLSTAKKVTPFSRTISVPQIIYYETVCVSRDYSSLFSSNWIILFTQIRAVK